MDAKDPVKAPSYAEILREWGRIGCIGFGGPPAHISLLRDLCVTRRKWLTESQFERAIAATNLLPGPASTQLAIYCAWRLRGNRGALLGGLCFILPGLIAILALSVLFLSGSPPVWVRGAAAGAGAAVAAVAVCAGLTVAMPIWRRAVGPERGRMLIYATAGAAASILVGPWLVLVLLACGTAELLRRRGVASAGGSVLMALSRRWHGGSAHRPGATPLALLAAAGDPGGTPALVWTALKVGALAFGGGFVIVPLMQSDAVSTYHWMSHAQFLNAVALGQVTPGPVTQTVAAVGYSADGLPGGLLAALVAFAPSFSFILLGAARFENDVALRTSIPGVATGLAWTPAGGDILFIESSRVRGGGKLILTGQLGEVMKESAQAAVTLVKSQADRLGVNASLLEDCDLHIHVPAGAIPKDGPSAGVAIATSLASLLTQRTVRADVAMTGEISLRGVVMPVGGIKEKCVAAARAGIRTVILPARNRRDFEDIPESVRKKLEFVWAEKIDDVFARALDQAPEQRAAA